MIDNTRKKLREAQFFLAKLEGENHKVVRAEPEAFDFYYSAYVSAARSVTFFLGHEESERYKQWSPSWFAALPDADQSFMDEMLEQRNDEIHRGGSERGRDGEESPVNELSEEQLGGQVYWCGPPGEDQPLFIRPVQYIKGVEGEPEALSACRRYFDLLVRLVDDFVTQYSD